MTFLTYQLKVAVIMAVFYIFYRLFLNKDTWHRLNRMVLLCTALLSFLLPVCIITLHKTQVIHITDTIETLTHQGTAEAILPDAPWWHIALASAYLAGVAFVLFRIAASILRVRTVIKNARKEMLPDGTCVYVMEGDAPSFSWMGHIVISQSDWHCGNPGIIRHEKAHVTLHHSIDVLVTDIASAVQWFNPSIWMLRTDLRAVHEYEADDTVLRAGTDLRSYQYLLISPAAAMNGYTIANNFNHSILKNRIFMMEKETSTRRSLLRALYLLPLVCICLAVNAQTKVQYRYVYDHSVLGDSTVTTPDNKFVMSAYKIPQGTDMDSLIRSLPGVEVNEKGELTVNGKSIGRILVNGQAITFGNSDSSYFEMKKFIEETIRQAEGIKTNLNKGVAAKVQAVNDTILSYSTNYKLPAGESVEDLINKLPGVGTDDDGNMTINGKPVSRVLVNGQPYYPNQDAKNIPDHTVHINSSKSLPEYVSYSDTIVETKPNGAITTSITSGMFRPDAPDLNGRISMNVVSIDNLDDVSIEDMLRSMPGVEVQDDGTYTVNGKAVSRILVNGEELKQEKDEANSSSTISITTATKSIDENGNITIDTQNGTIINLNGTQTTK